MSGRSWAGSLRLRILASVAGATSLGEPIPAGAEVMPSSNTNERAGPAGVREGARGLEPSLSGVKAMNEVTPFLFSLVSMTGSP